MQRKSFSQMPCPLARSLELIGEWWSILILRDALNGLTRFDEFQKSLDIAPNMLTRRLAALVEAGMLARQQYCDRPPRFEYVTTERTHDLRPILWALLDWGNKYCAPEGLQLQIANKRTGAIAEPLLVDRATGQPLTPDEFEIICGPAACDVIKERIALTIAKNSNNRTSTNHTGLPAERTAPQPE